MALRKVITYSILLMAKLLSTGILHWGGELDCTDHFVRSASDTPLVSAETPDSTHPSKLHYPESIKTTPDSRDIFLRGLSVLCQSVCLALPYNNVDTLLKSSQGIMVHFSPVLTALTYLIIAVFKSFFLFHCRKKICFVLLCSLQASYAPSPRSPGIR